MQRKLNIVVKALIVVMCVVIVGVLIATSSMYSSIQRQMLPETMLPDDTGWTYELNGESISFVPGDPIVCDSETMVIAKRIEPSQINGGYLLFENNRQGVMVAANGTEIYEMGFGPRSTKLSATGYQVVALPVAQNPYVLTITYSSLKDGVCETSPTYFGSINDVTIFLCMKSLFLICTTPLWFLLVIALAALMVIMIFNTTVEYRLTCLIAFLFLVVVYDLCDVPFSCLFSVNQEILSSTSYYMLMLMPMPIVMYVSLSCVNRPASFYNVYVLLILANILVQSVLYMTGIASLYSMLRISQALLFVSLIFGMINIALDYRKKKNKAALVQIFVFLFSALLGLSSIVVYWLGFVDLYQPFFQCSILFFLLVSFFSISYSVLLRSYDVKYMDAEINALKTLAVIDQLTGLSNRRAFDQKLESIHRMEDLHSNALLVFLDLNGLKYTNDKFGHLAGDELLISASRVIDQTFSPVGTVYRIGGDEFAVIIEDASVNLNQFYDEMEERIAVYNEGATAPLSIAKGSSSLVGTNGRRGTISDWKMHADKNMYKDKVKGRLLSASGSASDYLEIISSFVSAVDAKDSYTADHSERVAVLSDTICRMLGVSETSIDQIHIAASLHDIGKIGIPDSILLKEGGLDDHEFQVIQTHPIIGEDIVKHTKAFFEVSQIIRHHHERFDGKGYPDGISGKAIPFGARVVAIADSIDAITSNRSYRNARTLEYCKEEIRKNLGVMYDPAIGEIVLENWARIEAAVLTDNLVPEE